MKKAEIYNLGKYIYVDIDDVQEDETENYIRDVDNRIKELKDMDSADLAALLGVILNGC